MAECIGVVCAGWRAHCLIEPHSINRESMCCINWTLVNKRLKEIVDMGKLALLLQEIDLL